MTNLDWISSSRIYSDEENFILHDLNKKDSDMFAKLDLAFKDITFAPSEDAISPELLDLSK